MCLVAGTNSASSKERVHAVLHSREHCLTILDAIPGSYEVILAGCEGHGKKTLVMT